MVNHIQETGFSSGDMEARARFGALDSQLKKEVVKRAKQISKDIDVLKENKDISKAFATHPKMKSQVTNFLPMRPNEASVILRILYDSEQTKEIKKAAEWVERLMRSQLIELNPNVFSGIEIMQYWMPYMDSLGLVKIEEDDTKVYFETEAIPEIVIWHLAQARAYCLYGVHLGYTISRDRIEQNLDFYGNLTEEIVESTIYNLVEPFEIANEISDLHELIYFRMSMDDGEGPLIDSLAILSGIDKRSVSNASVVGEKKGDLIPKEKNKRKQFTVSSAEKWLKERKKNKYDYQPSIRYPGDHHWDGHISIPVNNIDELKEFIDHYSELLD